MGEWAATTGLELPGPVLWAELRGRNYGNGTVGPLQPGGRAA
jgi:hypothetical protein